MNDKSRFWDEPAHWAILPGTLILVMVGFLWGLNQGLNQGDSEHRAALTQAVEKEKLESDYTLQRTVQRFEQREEQLGKKLHDLSLEVLNSKIPTTPCAMEDSPGPCYWDSGVRGNGGGRSFWVDAEQKIHFFDGGVR